MRAIERNKMNHKEEQAKCLAAVKAIDAILTRNNIWFSLSYGSALGAYREGGFIEWDRDFDLLIKLPDQKKVNELLMQNLPRDYRIVSYDTDTISGFDEVKIIGISAYDMHIDLYPVIGAPDDVDVAFSFMQFCRRIHRVLSCKHLEFSRLTSKAKIPFVVMIRLVEYLIPDRILRDMFEKIKRRYPFEKAKLFFPIGNDGNKAEIMEGDLLFKTKRIAFEDVFLPVPEQIRDYLERIYGSDYMTPKRY